MVRSSGRGSDNGILWIKIQGSPIKSRRIELKIGGGIDNMIANLVGVHDEDFQTVIP